MKIVYGKAKPATSRSVNAAKMSYGTVAERFPGRSGGGYGALGFATSANGTGFANTSLFGTAAVANAA